jgi:PPOX class probable F420-dependent enzyme
MIGKDERINIPQKVRDLFNDELRVGYLATARPDQSLSVVPVGVVIHEGKLRISSPTKTFKIRNLRKNPQVAICVTEPGDARRYVTIRGTAELADDTDRAFITWLARTHMGLDDYPFEPKSVSRTVITIRPERFSMPKVHGPNDRASRSSTSDRL